MSDFHTENNLLRTVRILKATPESPSIKTFLFADDLCSRGKPGQFVMVWIPRFDEIPMSVSSAGPRNLASITVARVGEATQLLHRKAEGDVIGVRGPFGNSFKLVNSRALVVGGGTGIAPLFFLISNLLQSRAQITCLLGAKSKSELIFLPQIERKLSGSHGLVLAATEDGSHGHKGTVTELAKDAMKKRKFDMIYACGKEAMLLKIFSLAERHKTPLQASLERLVRCAIGLCGSCTIGRYRVCADGPVFTSEQLREVRGEFGRCRRELDGRKTLF